MRTKGWRPYALAGGSGVALYFVLPWVLAKDLLYEAIGASAAVAIVVGVRAHHPSVRTPWHLLVLGQILFVGGDIAWSVFANVLHTDPFPSIADVLYLAGYPCFAVGLVLLVRARTPGADRPSLIDASILSLALGVMAWVFWIDRYVEDQTLSLTESVISAAYPLGDLLLIAVVARLAVGSGHRSPAYRLLMASLVLLLFADVGFAWLDRIGAYTGPHPIDAVWLLSYVALGAAALHPSMRSLSEPGPPATARLTRRRLVLLTVASLAVPIVFAIQELRGMEVDGAVVVLGSAGLFVLAIARMAGLLRDIEWKAAELSRQGEALQRALDKEHRVVDELHELNRMKGDFVAMVSHELRTPLTTIIGYAKTLAQRELADDPAFREEAIGVVVRQGERLLGLVENLLTTSQVESRALPVASERVTIRDLFADVLESASRGRERVRVVLPDQPITLLTDRHLLGRAMTNLLDNALKYSPDGSPCEMGARLEGGMAALWVKDRGVGIAAENLERIFDRFYQVDSSRTRRYSGVGLGLALVKEIAEHLGGSITVESTPDVGSTFTLALPMPAQPIAPRPGTAFSGHQARLDLRSG